MQRVEKAWVILGVCQLVWKRGVEKRVKKGGKGECTGEEVHAEQDGARGDLP
jgi:hypothetical protein